MKRLLREPLVHFLLLGAALFALYSWRSGGVQAKERIVVGQGEIEHLVTAFQRTWMRPPSEVELSGVIADYVRDEVAWREAHKLGLERDDAVLRRRLRQKLEFLSEDLTAQAQPSEAELEQWLAEHPDAFRNEARTTFRHVYFSRERRGDAAEADARALLARLASGAEADDGELGDPLLLPPALEGATPSEIDAQFGAGFAAALDGLPLDAWSGPVASSYGLHLVRVEAREPGTLPPLADVRPAVWREWFAARRSAGLEEFYRQLLTRYEVSIERPADVSAAEAAR